MNQAENQTSSSLHPAPDETHAPRLRREAMRVSSDRGRLGLLVALCSLAGVVVGFGLSNMAAVRLQHCATSLPVVASHASAAAVDTPTWLGVRISTAAHGGALVQAVDPSSPAQVAGIRRGDVIQGMSTGHCSRSFQAVNTAGEMVRMVRGRDAGDTVRLRVQRKDQDVTVRAQLAQMPVPLFLDEVR
jgi:S1-C subfamily serine protease